MLRENGWLSLAQIQQLESLLTKPIMLGSSSYSSAKIEKGDPISTKLLKTQNDPAPQFNSARSQSVKKMMKVSG
jgi:hypothetical protein